MPASGFPFSIRYKRCFFPARNIIAICGTCLAHSFHRYEINNERTNPMPEMDKTEAGSPARHRQEQIEKYWAGDMTRKVYLFRRQRKAILENCCRIAVIGASADPNSASFVMMERLLGLGLEIIPVFPGRESLLGLRCYARLGDIPGRVDLAQVYPSSGIHLTQVALDAVEKGVDTLWIENGMAASPEIEEILSNGRVHLVEYESLETEYLKHTPMMTTGVASLRKDRKAAKIKERMTRNPATVKIR
jgi:uncharacterized protein